MSFPVNSMCDSYIATIVLMSGLPTAVHDCSYKTNYPGYDCAAFAYNLT